MVVCVRERESLCVCVCMCMRMCVCVCVCVIYIHTYDVNAAQVRARLGDGDGAEAFLREAFARESAHTPTLCALGMLMLERGNRLRVCVVGERERE